MSDVRYNLKGLNELKKVLPSWTLGLQYDIAKKVPENIVNNIQKKKTGIYPSANLPENEPATKRIKQRRGQGTLSLIATGLLTNIGNWVVSKSGKAYIVKPPAGRRDIVNYLQQGVGKKRKQYKIFELPASFLPRWIKDMITSKFNKFMAKYA